VSWEIEFGTKGGADDAREEFDEYVCPADDDRRLKTVAFVDDTPDWARDRIEAAAATGQAEGAEGSGQVELTEEEKNRVGPFEGSNNYRKAAAVKALLLDNGVSDWEAWYDSTLTVDEHRSSVLPEAQQAGGGDRIESDGPDREAAARAEKAVNEECDHAADHCRHGDPEACEYLTMACGFEHEEIDDLLEAPGDQESEDLPGKTKGALGRAWGGYKAAVSRLDQELRDAEEAKHNAERAAAAINRIRRSHGQDDLEFDRLEELSTRLSEAGEAAHDGEAHIET